MDKEPLFNIFRINIDQFMQDDVSGLLKLFTFGVWCIVDLFRPGYGKFEKVMMIHA